MYWDSVFCFFFSRPEPAGWLVGRLPGKLKFQKNRPFKTCQLYIKFLANLNVFGSSVWGAPFEALPMLGFEDLRLTFELLGLGVQNLGVGFGASLVFPEA